MGDTPSNFSQLDNKSKVGIILAVLVIHAGVAVGLSKLPPLELKKPEPPKPIEITFIQPEIEPEPVVEPPTPAPVVEPTPPKPPKPVEPPPPLPPKKVVEKVEPKKVEPKKIEKPVTPPKEIVKVEKPVDNKPNQWEIEQQKQREREKEQERERQQREADEKARQQREADEKARQQREADEKARQQREADEKARQQREADEKAKQQREAEEKAKQQQNNTPVQFSESQARWKRQPRIAIKQEYAEENLRVVFRLTVNKQGKIDNIAVSKSSGNSKFDSEMRRQLASASLHPFEQNGVPVVGIVNVSVP